MNELDRPAYSPTEAGHLVGLRPERVTRWLLGYCYAYPVGRTGVLRPGHQDPVIHRQGARGSRYASFLDLIDLLFVRQFLEYGIPLQRLRCALEEVARLFPGHHFAQRTFFTDGHAVYLRVKETDAECLLELLSNGQWVIAPLIEQIAHQIVFHDVSGFAERWYPLGLGEPIVIDPKVAFGSPTIRGRGIKTSNVVDFYEAEGERVEAVCSWMNLTRTEVDAAVQFERQLLAA